MLWGDIEVGQTNWVTGDLDVMVVGSVCEIDSADTTGVGWVGPIVPGSTKVGITDRDGMKSIEGSFGSQLLIELEIFSKLGHMDDRLNGICGIAQ